jgi:hypothetical protein
MFMNYQAKSQTVTDNMVLKYLVAQYVHSIREADTVSGSEIWSHTAEVSFGIPGGTGYGAA